jgi:ABC-2 type transport system permease protein
MYGITMRTLDHRGISNLVSVLILFFSGNIVPLPLFPDAMQPALRSLPFAQVLDAPIRCYLGDIGLKALPRLLLVQLGWTAALWAGGWLLWRANIRRLVIQGG